MKKIYLSICTGNEHFIQSADEGITISSETNILIFYIFFLIVFFPL